MVKSLLCWPPGCSTGPDWRFNILSRARYCGGAVSAKCVHEDLQCCCGGGEAVCCCKVLDWAITQIPTDIFEALVVETGEIYNLKSTQSEDCCIRLVTHDPSSTPFRFPNVDPVTCPEFRRFGFEMCCPNESTGEDCTLLTGRPITEPIYCNEFPWTPVGSCDCGDGTSANPFSANFGPFTFTPDAGSGVQDCDDCGTVNIVVRQIVFSPGPLAALALSPTRRAASFKPLTMQRTVPEDEEEETELPEGLEDWLGDDEAEESKE